MSDTIDIIEAETHNLQKITVSIPKNKLTVVTGVSGSGKSSLAFDTLYAEGKRRYLESLSTYARMMSSDISEATIVREIRGLSPTIAINQKTVSKNPRSTVGTITEIYDFYRLLFTNIGVGYCPDHPNISLTKHTIQQIYEDMLQYSGGTKIYITFPDTGNQVEKKIPISVYAQYVSDKGFVRFLEGNIVYSVADTYTDTKVVVEDMAIIVDRLIIQDDKQIHIRLKDSLQVASEKGNGVIAIYLPDTKKYIYYSLQSRCSRCGFILPNLTISNFSFNSHYGACNECQGIGTTTTFIEQNVIDDSLSLSEGAIIPWSSHPYYGVILKKVCEKYKIDIYIPYGKLPQKHKTIILHGTDDIFELQHSKIEGGRIIHTKYEGVLTNLERRFRESEGENDKFFGKIKNFATNKKCRSCNGYKLQKPFLNVKIGGKNIDEVVSMSVDQSIIFFSKLTLSKTEQHIAKSILRNICERLEFLQGVGLGYIELNRGANTLSGGESQRIRLATQIGTRLEGIIYILDEPSIGLHARDNNLLIGHLRHLVEIGNTVVVVEHDEDIMRKSDYIIDIGPKAGKNGGNVVYSGDYTGLLQSHTETAKYISGEKIISRKQQKITKKNGYIVIHGAQENNLKNITVRIPLHCMTVITGVSGSGKSSLILDILSNALHNIFGRSIFPVGKHEKIEGLEGIDKYMSIDQSPIGKTPHSNVATYTGVLTYIREVFAASLDAKKRGFGSGRFSFNTKSGRCEICEGSGTKKIEMHFLPDVYIECESCGGMRYNKETLQIQYKGKNIGEVLAMSVEEAYIFFSAFPRISRILGVLQEIGLGYITLGQSAMTLSGGESQRIKLASDLIKRSTGNTLYILDEPTTGLHFSDIQKLLEILDRLVQKGNSVIVIEHNLDIIANADAIIDIGPEGGVNGGQLLYAGPQDKFLQISHNATAQALREYMERRKKS